MMNRTSSLTHLIMKTENVIVNAYLVKLHKLLDGGENVKHL